ncbi:DsrE family protein [Paraglaciecola sp. L1A13]|uniref:DsrE family protein n=1 Tax=Paraglaciecola sp. L1A13 TaxID=2686359 RepID=UPI001E54805B|nr:DsrE family protein [Paraglaciecola sp. L1A13]
MKKLTILTLMLLLSSVGGKSMAAEFADGPVIFGYGKHAPVQQDMKLEKGAVLKVVFDVSQAGKDGALNRSFDTVARFLNMHVANGVPAKDIHLAIVVHGSASNEMLNARAYNAKYDKENPNSELISKLLKNNVKFVLCGQSAAFNEITNQDMIEGVDMALSAMTAHAIFAAQGYSQNPF